MADHEVHWRRTDDGFFDLGPLRVPATEGVRLSPLRNERGDKVLSVTVVRGRAAIQVQLFDASAGLSWASVRRDLSEQVRQRGGTVREIIGRSGPELQANLFTSGPDGRTRTMDVRFVGREEQGRLLRGLITGVGATPGSDDAWSYQVFEETAVKDTGTGTGRPATTLRWPPVEVPAR
ncbi:DUF3710 domain-containing protein [Streptomyces sp. NPDC094032]|uniref:DUF3710 domain-containing protein n=1 Tax=Streptomyces sp. NPDC094032 TaxID=3155308 RepID=UPI003317F67E